MPMDNSQFETIKPSQMPFNFPPHRRRPLKSKTFSKLVQIVSHCHNHSHALEAIPEGPILDSSDSVFRGGDELLEHNHIESENLSVGKELLVDENQEIMGSQAAGHNGNLHMDVDGLDNMNNINSNDDVRLIDNQEDQINLLEFDMEEFGPLDDVIAGSSKSRDDKGKESQQVEINECEVHLKEKEFEKLISSSDLSVANEEVEEGEISGDARVYGDLMDFLLEEDPVSKLDEQRVDSDQTSQGILDKEDLAVDEPQKKFEKDVGFSPLSVDAVNKMSENMEDELRKSNYVSLVENDDKASALSVEDNADAKTKKKRRAPQTEENKEKKKSRKRKRRAEMNRKLGVHRLKLEPLPPKPKPINECRHFIKGRCHEGEKCNFSHDVIPKTKSKPCCHHARGSCLKGDECPYDHDLSKYACNNYVTNGFCSRGAACMFKHDKIPVKEGGPTAQNVSNPELKSVSLPSSLPSNSIPKHQINGQDASHRNPNVKSSSICISPRKTTQQNAPVSFSKPASPAPKGISFLSNGYLSRKDDRTVDNVAKTGNQTTPEVPKTTPVPAPRGINFLSFGKGIGKSPSSDSVVCKTPPVVATHDIKSSLGDSITNKKQANSISKENNAVPVLQSLDKLGDNKQSTSCSSSFSEKVQLLSSTPSSVHKALHSTLAFAARMDKSVGASAVAGSSQNQSTTKASTILDFLYGDRNNNKSKQ